MDLLSVSVLPVTSVHGLNCSTAAERSWQSLVFLVSVQFSYPHSRLCCEGSAVTKSCFLLGRIFLGYIDWTYTV